MKKLLITLCACSFLLGGHAQNIANYNPDLKELYRSIDSCDVDLRAKHIPLIGLSSNQLDGGGARLSGTYIQSIIKAGGAPVLIPAVTDGETLRSIVASLDGLVLTGGEDINPLWYGEEPRQQLQTVDPVRDVNELKLLKLAADRNLPVLGICRGEQLMNVAFGGTLYQDIPSQRRETPIKHVQDQPGRHASHTVTVTSGSQLAAIIGEGRQQVNSLHHQAVKDLAPGFRIVAISPDSVVEAIEAWPNRPMLGVQWHPESLTTGGDTTMLKVFRFLVDKATTYHKAREMHKRFLSVDTHTDTPFWFRKAGFSIADREVNRVNLPKMEEGGLDGVFLAAFVGQGKRDATSLQAAVDKAVSLIEGIRRQAELNKDLCGIAIGNDDFVRLKAEGKRAFFIGIENGYAIGKDLNNIARFKSMGVNYITLCHSYDNDICDSSSKTEKEWNGLSPFGEEVVKEMNRQGVVVDLSHAAESTFWDVMKQTKVPFICSHSSSKAKCFHDRNLTDEQLRALKQNGSVAQVCLLDMYINRERKKASVGDAVEHIDHMVKVAGIDHVGIGSDFDGGGGLIGCEGANDLMQITVKLIEKGYSEEDIAKIWGGNLMRVLDEVQAAATAKMI